MSDFPYMTIKNLDLAGHTILLRADYNVPLAAGRITSDLRLRASLPTIEYLISHGAQKIILLSHLGKPKGRPDPDLSLAPVAGKLQELLGRPVAFCPSLNPADIKRSVASLPAGGGLLLLENLRFDPREEENSPDFAQELVDATGATLFVQDGFAVIHRAHASTAALPQLLPAVAGLLVENEVANLSNILHNPEKPFVIIIGGAKVEDKAPLIAKLAPQADRIFVGGKIAADGYTAEKIMNSDNSSDSGAQSTSAPGSATHPAPANSAPAPTNSEALADKLDIATDFTLSPSGAKLDVAPAWVAHLTSYLTSHQVKTVLWNGTLGQVEQPEFSAASRQLAEFLGHHPAITTIICGGDTSGFAENLATRDPSLHFALISTGGGASLELLSGLPLPGLTALQERKKAPHFG